MGTSRRIPLYNRRGEVIDWTLVDAADYPELGQYRWYLRQQGYVGRTKDGCRVYLHRELLGLRPGDGRYGDHINRNRRDNRRSNLRVVTKAQQQQNMSKREGHTSRYRGVHQNRATGGWVAQVTVDGAVVSLGTFDTELLAARVAADYRREHLPFSHETLPPLKPDEIPDPSRARRKASSKHKGVAWSKNAGRWMAYHSAGGKRKYLGYFDTEEQAAEAVAVA